MELPQSHAIHLEGNVTFQEAIVGFWLRSRLSWGSLREFPGMREVFRTKHWSANCTGAFGLRGGGGGGTGKNFFLKGICFYKRKTWMAPMVFKPKLLSDCSLSMRGYKKEKEKKSWRRARCQDNSARGTFWFQICLADVAFRKKDHVYLMTQHNSFYSALYPDPEFISSPAKPSQALYRTRLHVG